MGGIGNRYTSSLKGGELMNLPLAVGYSNIAILGLLGWVRFTTHLRVE